MCVVDAAMVSLVEESHSRSCHGHLLGLHPLRLQPRNLHPGMAVQQGNDLSIAATSRKLEKAIHSFTHTP